MARNDEQEIWRMIVYEFNPDDAFRFARFVGIKTYQHGDELIFKECCYCHGKGRSNEDKFAINLKTGVFNCLRASCGAHGNMITLAKDFDFSLGRDFDNYYAPKKRYQTIKHGEKTIIPKPAALKYLEGRGISKETAERYEITTRKDDDNIIVFPFRDEAGRLWSAKYRRANFDKDKDKNKEWCEKDRKPILFGMYQCNMENKRLVICEGQIDSLSVAESGIENAVSVPTGANGFTWVPYCWDFVNQFETIVVFGDYEKGHITLLDEISRRFRKHKVLHVREEDYKDCKDANDILRKYGKEQVVGCVENAVPIPIKNIIDLADVEDVDVFELEKLRTGIRQLDDLLYGGLPFGGITLITGKTGKGKSCLASQIIAYALFNGYVCFAYSGELPNYLFRAWLDFQIAGKNHVIEYQNKWGDKRLNVSKVNRAEIANWYRGKCFLYDNSVIPDEEDERKALLDLIEDAIMQYGVRVVLIDNLMTALDLDASKGADKYDKQSAFIKKMTRIALMHNVLILLVAHKRKNNFSGNDNDEIAGSSDIANLGMITLSYDSDKKIDESQRLLKVPKNRLFGKVETYGFLLNYDEKSKRIYGVGDNLDFDFGWSKEEVGSTNQEEKDDGFMPLDDEGGTPFDEME